MSSKYKKVKKEKEEAHTIWIEIRKDGKCYSVNSDDETSPKRAYANACQKLYFKLYEDNEVTSFLFPKL